MVNRKIRKGRWHMCLKCTSPALPIPAMDSILEVFPNRTIMKMKWNSLPALGALTLSVLSPVIAQDIGMPTAELLSDAYTGNNTDKVSAPRAARC